MDILKRKTNEELVARVDHPKSPNAVEPCRKIAIFLNVFILSLITLLTTYHLSLHY